MQPRQSPECTLALASQHPDLDSTGATWQPSSGYRDDVPKRVQRCSRKYLCLFYVVSVASRSKSISVTVVGIVHHHVPLGLCLTSMAEVMRPFESVPSTEKCIIPAANAVSEPGCSFDLSVTTFKHLIFTDTCTHHQHHNLLQISRSTA